MTTPGGELTLQDIQAAPQQHIELGVPHLGVMQQPQQQHQELHSAQPLHMGHDVAAQQQQVHHQADEGLQQQHHTVDQQQQQQHQDVVVGQPLDHQQQQHEQHVKYEQHAQQDHHHQPQHQQDTALAQQQQQQEEVAQQTVDGILAQQGGGDDQPMMYQHQQEPQHGDPAAAHQQHHATATELLPDGSAAPPDIMGGHPHSVPVLGDMAQADSAGGGSLGNDVSGLGGSSAELNMDRPPVNRVAIIAEVQSRMQQQLSDYTDEQLHQWLAVHQAEFYTASATHHKAKDLLKQVDGERALARDAFRADQGCSDKHRAWKAKVSSLKEAQEQLRQAKEVYYRAQASVEAITLEIKRRTKREAPRTSEEPPPRTTGNKRRKSNAPEESCPYCHHTYTVRDGLSQKTDEFGNRLHMRKCQCREKTPPCRNCPKCKDNNAIMGQSDIHVQFQMCQMQFKCEICQCRCPGAGKWIETDEASRKSYAERTQQRHQELQTMGWYSVPTANLLQAAQEKKPKSPGGGSIQAKSGMPESLSKNKVLRRLPADIRAQMEMLQGRGGPLGLMPSDPSQQHQQQEEAGMEHVTGVSHDPSQQQQQHHLVHAAQQQQQQQQLAAHHHQQQQHHDQQHHHHHALDVGSGAVAAMSTEALLADPAAAVLAAATAPGAALPGLQMPLPLPDNAPSVRAPLPALPPDVGALVMQVFQGSCGDEGVAAVSMFLQAQRVTSLADLRYLELHWLQDYLGPQGLPPLLLNKFLRLAKGEEVLEEQDLTKDPLASDIVQQQHHHHHHHQQGLGGGGAAGTEHDQAAAVAAAAEAEAAALEQHLQQQHHHAAATANAMLHHQHSGVSLPDPHQLQ